MSATSVYLESLLEQCGGFSRFQWIMFSFMMYSRIAAIWTMLMMTFAGAIPDWQCRFTNYTTLGTTPSINTDDIHYIDGHCYPPQNVTVRNCQEYKFYDSMNTVVSEVKDPKGHKGINRRWTFEWTLICDKDWIASTITTIQMTALVVSCVASGHLADHIGRKPTYFLSLIVLTVLNTISGFSTSWKMFAVLRCLLGFGIGVHITVFFGYMIEFIPARRRSVVIAFPSWSILACVLGFVAMWLHDWRYLHFATAILTLPCIFMWWFLPESFRYLVTHNRLDEAMEVVCKIARINGKPEPDMSKMSYLVKVDLKVDPQRKYTMLDVAKSPQLLKYTCLLGIAWMSCGYGYFAISFNVQSLSGSLYLNMFLLSVVEIPVQAASCYLTNRFGRKWVTLTLLLIAGISGFVVAALQISDLDMKNSLINIFVLASKMGVGAGWGTLMILSLESYPTVVRNIGFGMLSSIARIGAIAAPQLVYVNIHLPGVMFFIFGGLMILSAFGLFFMQETNKKPIEDGIATEQKGQKKTPHSESYTNEAFDTRL